MANQEHVDLLNRGSLGWYMWRTGKHIFQTDSTILREVDLSGADLSGLDLSGFDLSEANMRGVALNGTNLRKCNLSGADLRDTNLSEAKLSGTNSPWDYIKGESAIAEVNLSMANLSNCILSEIVLNQANLSGANLNRVNLSKAKLRGVNLNKANLVGANLMDVNLMEADLRGADLTDANLAHANMIHAALQMAKLTRASLFGANLSSAILVLADLSYTSLLGTNLYDADLTQSDLTNAELINVELTRAKLIETNFANATIENCFIYGISAWDVKLEGAVQRNLIISPEDEAVITVDNLKIAQFIYLLLNNAEIRDVIDTITGKAALILGRFTDERKAILDAIRDALRQQGYLPILFDFEKPTSKDLTETILTLASLSRFVIADLSDPNSIPHELMSFAEKLLSVPIKPIFCPTKEHPNPYPMFEDHLGRLPHVLSIYRYKTQDKLMAELKEKIILPAEKKANKLRPKPL